MFSRIPRSERHLVPSDSEVILTGQRRERRPSSRKSYALLARARESFELCSHFKAANLLKTVPVWGVKEFQRAPGQARQSCHTRGLTQIILWARQGQVCQRLCDISPSLSEWTRGAPRPQRSDDKYRLAQSRQRRVRERHHRASPQGVASSQLVSWAR